MTKEKRNNRFTAIKALATKLQSKLSKKQAQLEKDFAKQDAMRLEEYYYDQGEVNSTALAKRRMKERRGFSRLEAEFRQEQASFSNTQVSQNVSEQQVLTDNVYANQAHNYYKQQLLRDKTLQASGQQAISGQVSPTAKKQSGWQTFVNNVKSNLHKISSKRLKRANRQKKSLLEQAQTQSKTNASVKSIIRQQQNTSNVNLPAKSNFKERLMGFIYGALTIFVKPQKLDLNQPLAAQPMPRGKITEAKLTDVNQQLEATIIKMQKQEKKRRLLTAFCFSFSLLILALVIGKVILNQTGSKLQLHILKNGDLEQQFPAFGFVAREERVLYSPVAGEIEAIKAEGSLVAADQEIANIVTSDISDIKRKNDNIEQQISEQILTMLKRGKNMQANQLFAKADSSMLPTLNLLRRDLSLNKLGHLNNYIYTLQPFMQERNFSLRQMNLADPIIDSLRTEQKVLAHELQEKARIIETPSAGLISYKINPQLIDINTETIQSMSYDQFIGFFNSAKPSISTNGKKVKEQVPVIRLVDTRYQYFLLQVANAKSTDFVVGKNYKLQVAGVGQKIENCNVLRVTPDTGGVLLLLKCDRNVESLLDQVAIKAKIIKSTRNGLIVPKVALVYEDVNRESTAYVEVLKGGFVEKERVRVLESNEQYAIIEGLNEKDTVIAENTIVVLNPRQVKTGQQVT